MPTLFRYKKFFFRNNQNLFQKFFSNFLNCSEHFSDCSVLGEREVGQIFVSSKNLNSKITENRNEMNGRSEAC